MDTFPDFPQMWRSLTGRVAELERQRLGRAQADIQATRDALWQPITLLNGYQQGSTVGSFAEVAYYKDTFGRVWLRGHVVSPAVPPPPATPMFTMPVGFRPIFTHWFTVPGVTLYLGSNGDVLPAAPPAASTLFPVHTLSFRVV